MANIHDVARVAGVSISTVSYALSGKRSIAESTKRRIEKAVADLGYQPNAGARMLAGTQTRILALTAPLRADTSAPAHMSFVLAVATAARRFDYDVLLLTEDEATTGLRRVASSRLVDGIIVLDVSTEDERVELIRDLGIPTTLVGIPRDTQGLVCVDLNFEEAARLAVRRLHDLGHRAIALFGHPQISYDRGSNFPTRFRDAFIAEATRLAMVVAAVAPEREVAGVRHGIDEIADRVPGCSAIVMHCEENTQRTALEILRERGVSVPGDVSIISACSSFATERLDPPLDVIPLSPTDSCSRAVDLTLGQIAGGVQPHIELLTPSYIARGSTARLSDKPADAGLLARRLAS